MRITLDNNKSLKRLEALVLSIVLLCLILIPGLFSSSYAILKYGDTFNRCVFKITTDSHANGWDEAKFEVDYYDKDGNKQRKEWDITDEMSEGEEILLDLNEQYAKPYKIHFYMEFGGGMTIRKQSGKIEYIFQTNTLAEWDYSAWSYPFSSYDSWTSYDLPAVTPMMLIDEEADFDREMESLSSAFEEADWGRKYTIKLLSDAELTAPIDVSSDNITLDLNGYAITKKNTGGSSTIDGMMFYIGDKGKLTIIDSKSDRDNGTEYDGGILTKGNMDGDGGCFYIERGGSLSIKGCSIENCDANENGGAIYCRGELSLDGTDIIHCDAKENGGAVVLTEAAKAKFKDVTIDDCDAKENGGAIYMTGTAEAELNDVTIKGCDAEDLGGAVYMKKDSILKASGLNARKCEAEYGGAFYIEEQSALRAEESTVEQCKAEESGGGMYYQAADLVLNNCEWNGCHAGEDGGAVYLITRNGNKHKQDLYKQTFTDCSADELGGALYTIDDAAARAVSPTTLESCSFKGNTAETGGGVYLESLKVYFINTSVTGNTANGKDGGGIYVDSMKDIEVAGKVVIRDNKSSRGTNNLALQNGLASTAYLYSGGLYDGSYIGISSTSGGKVTVAKNVSTFNAYKALHSDDSRRAFVTEGEYGVMTPLVASMISDDASITIIVVGLVLMFAVIMLLLRRKNKKGAAGKDE